MNHARRRQILLVAGVIWIAPTLARAQQATKPYRIGLLAVEPDEILRQSLRDLGYVEGRDFILEFRDTGGSAERVNELSIDLVRQNVDVIVATYPSAVISAKRATATIPIVMMNTPDPVQLGLVASLARPGGNITGLTTLTVDVSSKQLELLKEAVPRASRIAVLWNPDNPWHPVAVKRLHARSTSLGLQLQVLEVRGPDTIDRAFSAMTAERAQAVLVLADPMLFVHRQRLADLALKHRLPMMGNVRAYAGAGSLLSYWADRADLSRRAASYVDRILKGAKPGDLPIELPTKFELVINLKTAKTLGITIPQSLLLRADRAIE
jgi:putative tryptophan/tyrosine transport system substrate-binding protein